MNKGLSTGAKLLLALFFAGASFVWAGCDDDKTTGTSSGSSGSSGAGPHDSPYPSCKAITEACHEVDVGAGAIHDCHDRAHGAKSDADCAPSKDECVSLCTAAAADGGAHHDEDGGE